MGARRAAKAVSNLVARTRPLRRDLSVETAARLTHYQVSAAANARVLGSRGARELPAGTIWEFCASSLGFGPGSSRPS